MSFGRRLVEDSEPEEVTEEVGEGGRGIDGGGACPDSRIRSSSAVLSTTSGS